MGFAWLMWALLLAPVGLAGLCLLQSSARRVLGVVAGGGAVFGLLAVAAFLAVLATGPLESAEAWLRLDALSAWHLLILGGVFGAASLFSWGYFQDQASGAARLSLRAAHHFGGLWFGAATAMTLVLVSNNLGLMWVGIEATTLLTAFLISIHVSPLSLEAMWKYLLVCSVGVAFAFLGTLLLCAAARPLGTDAADTLLWTTLLAGAGSLSPALAKSAFIFMVVGYGTKAGLAPMHNWLPDAHSQAPAPVSALFSGFMLSAALYCIMRVLPLVEAVTGQQGWGRQILVALGLFSMLVAAAFIVFQQDCKRLLAYSSVEHMGIVALGLGLGGLGTFAALWHTLNHAIAKSLAFFAAGRLGQQYGSHDMGSLAGSLRRSPAWGLALLTGILALIGAAPFAIFMSEFQVLRAAVSARNWPVAVLFLVAAATVFAGALRHAIGIAWGEERQAPGEIHTSAGERAMIAVGIALLLLLGMSLPEPLRQALDQGAAIVGGQP
jgi:hydrogenase-4 component F